MTYAKGITTHAVTGSETFPSVLSVVSEDCHLNYWIFYQMLTGADSIEIKNYYYDETALAYVQFGPPKSITAADNDDVAMFAFSWVTQFRVGLRTNGGSNRTVNIKWVKVYP